MKITIDSLFIFIFEYSFIIVISMEKEIKKNEQDKKDQVKGHSDIEPKEVSEKEIEDANCRINPDPDLMDRG